MAKPRLPVPKDSRVLEIGSGHNPHPRATILLDRYLEDVERAGPLKRDRPFVLADGERLPFRSHSFDYVVALDVAEHTEDIGYFFDELARVAKAGYLETPSMVSERLFGWRKHRWQLLYHEGTLWVRANDGKRSFGTVFHELMRRDPQLTGLYYRYPALFRVCCEWRDRVPYELLAPDDPDPVDFDDPEVVRSLLAPRASTLSWLRAYVPRGVRDPIWRAWRDFRVRN